LDVSANGGGWMRAEVEVVVVAVAVVVTVVLESGRGGAANAPLAVSTSYGI